MYNLVDLKGNDIFTNSMIIAKGTGNQHHAVQQLIKKYEKEISEFGKVRFTHLKCDNSKGGRPIKLYELNEPQATFVMTLLNNSMEVVKFKLALTKEFYRMRKFIMERQSTEWLETRTNGKLTRRDETDVLQELIEYAINQGSGTYKNKPNLLYVHYSNLVNRVIGIKKKQRELATRKVLNTISFVEDMILHTVSEEMEKGTPYKDIYQKCKGKAYMIVELSYLPEQKLLSA